MKKSPARARSTSKSTVKPASEIIAEALSRVTQKPKSQSKAKSSPALTPAPPVAKVAARRPAKLVLDQKPVAKATVAATTIRKVTAPRGTTTRKNVAAPVKTAKNTSSKKVEAKIADVKTSDATNVEEKKAASPATALRATKKRAPKDLAIQYGEKEKTPRVSIPKATPRKRRDANMRARLQQVITPDEGVLLRLAQAGAISSSLAPEGVAGKPLRSVKARRSRKWETFCGKCGASAQYSTSAALCVRCGAILVRD